MLIEVVEESSNEVSPNQSSLESILNDFVEHFGQPIHLQTTKNDNVTVSPVLRVFMDKMKGYDIVDILECYPDVIRGAYLKLSPCTGRKVDPLAMAVLVYYEWAVSELVLENTHDLSEPSNDLVEILAVDLTIVQAIVDEISREWRTRLVVSLLKLLRIVLGVHQGIKINHRVARRCLCSLLSIRGPFQLKDVDPNLQEQILTLQVKFPPSLDRASLSIPEVVWEQVGLSTLIFPTDDEIDREYKETVMSFNRAVLPKNVKGTRATKSLSSVVQSLGVETLAEAIRAHYFERDGLKEDNVVAPPVQRLHLGRTVSETLKKARQPTNPSCLRASLHFCQLLETINEEILTQLLPMHFDLLDHSDEKRVCWGAASVFHLLRVDCQPANLWRNLVMTENLLSILNRVIETCRKGRVLAVVGAAQTLLFRRLGHSCQQQRRKATQQWMLILDRNTGCYTKDHLIWGLLFGGIAPLLFESANSENADGLELGRCGLSALLPVLCEGTGHEEAIVDGMDDDELDSSSNIINLSVQQAGLVALSNLLVAAHPIMHRHAGKLLCTIVSFLRRLDNESSANAESLTESLRRLAYHVANMIVVCSGERAVSVLNRISDDKYDSGIAAILERIRSARDHASS